MFIYVRRTVVDKPGRVGLLEAFIVLLVVLSLIALLWYVIIPVLLVWGLIRLVRRRKWTRGPSYSSRHSVSASASEGWRVPTSSILDLLE